MIARRGRPLRKKRVAAPAGAGENPGHPLARKSPAVTANVKGMTALEWGLLILLSVLWGGSFFFNGVARPRAADLDRRRRPRRDRGRRALCLVLRATGQGLPRGAGVWRAFFGMGLLNNVIPFSLIVWGQAHIASGLASILNGTTPFFAVLLAHWLTDDERLTPGRLAGVVIGFGGVAVLMGGEVLAAAGPGGGLWGQAACVAGAISYACAAIYGRRFRRMGLAPLATAAGQTVASSVVLLPLMLLVDRPWALPLASEQAYAALVGVALLSTALAYVLYFRILATAGATNLMLVTLLIPATAILLGAGLLGEALAARHFAGMALIAFGLVVLDGRAVRFLRRGIGRDARATRPIMATKDR